MPALAGGADVLRLLGQRWHPHAGADKLFAVIAISRVGSSNEPSSYHRRSVGGLYCIKPRLVRRFPAEFR